MLAGVISLGVIVTIAFLVVRVMKGGLQGMFLKAFASVCFICTAFAAFSYNRENFSYGVLMIIGLILSLLGDIWLDLKFVYREDETTFTFAGFICFLVGHCFFISAVFLGYETFKPMYALIAVGVSALFILASLGLEKIAKLDYGKYKLISMAYSFFVSGTMVASIIGMVVGGFTKKYIVLTVGSIAFLLSDVVLSGIYFKKDGNTKSAVILNHVLYYFAQFALASTLLM